MIGVMTDTYAKQTQRLKLAGRLFRDEIKNQGLVLKDTAPKKIGLGRGTLIRIGNGDPTVARPTLVQACVGIGWNEYFLEYVINGDITALKTMNKVRPALRDFAVRQLEIIEHGDPPAKRKTNNG
jgi:hypothetical protein